ncbi:MAG: PilZ domain-containing protein [Bdellovibrionota bacterium]
MHRPHYFLSSVKVFEGGKLSTAVQQALVSKRSIFRVFEESELIRRAFLESKTFVVELDGHTYLARLVQETGLDGMHYNLRLLNVDEELDLKLEGELKRRGIESPWAREYPRIPPSALAPEVEAPAGVIVTRVTGQATGRIMNFSYHGLMFELRCGGPSIGEYVGQEIRFRILTNRGRKLDEMKGRVARIYDEMTAPGELRRGLGVRLMSMGTDLRATYNGMILDACRDLSKAKE